MALDYLVGTIKIYGINIMISIYNLYIAKKRLALSHETIQMMEPNVPDMILAQHEMIEREIEYYREEVNKFTIIVLTLFAFAGIIGVLYVKGSLHVF